MSGGSYGYICFSIEEQLVGRMEDAELDEMAKDFAKLCHALEWWQSADTDEESYRREVKRFKKKWFNTERSERLEEIINQKCDDLKQELIKMI